MTIPHHRSLLPVVLALLANGCAPGQDDQTKAGAEQERAGLDPAPVVVLETNHGRIVMQLDREKAPLSVANFLRYVGAGFYDGLTFHRVRPNFMIQGGRMTPDRQRRTTSVPSVQSESENGLKNLRGTVAMARTRDRHSATSEFFINHVDNADLDFTGRSVEGWGYAVFGKVIEGLDVVDSIAAVPTERWGQHEAIPLDPVVIERAYLLESTGN